MYRLANVLPQPQRLFDTRREAELWLADHGYIKLDHSSWTVDDGEAFPYASAEDFDLDKPLDEYDAEEILEWYGLGFEPILVEIEKQNDISKLLYIYRGR